MVKSKLLQTSAPRNSLFSCVYWQMMVIIKLRSKNLATFTAGLEQNPGESVSTPGFIFLSSLAKITLQFGC